MNRVMLLAFLLPLVSAAEPTLGEAAATGATIGSLIGGPPGAIAGTILLSLGFLLWRKKKKR